MGTSTQAFCAMYVPLKNHFVASFKLFLMLKAHVVTVIKWYYYTYMSLASHTVRV